MMNNWTPRGWRPGRANRAVAAGLIAAALVLYAAGGRLVSAVLAVLSLAVMTPAPRDPDGARHRRYRGRVVCAWCSATIDDAIVPGLPDSHDICEQCSQSQT